MSSRGEEKKEKASGRVEVKSSRERNTRWTEKKTKKQKSLGEKK